MTTISNPRVSDNDAGEITITLEGGELRGFIYANDGERRQKMLQAREYVEGWCDASAPAQIAPEPTNRLPTLDEYRNNLVKQCAEIAAPWSGFAGVDKMGTQDREIIKVREEIAAAIMNLSVPSTDFCARAQTAPEPVAYRWQHVNDRREPRPWHYEDAPWSGNEYMQAEPLYAAPAQRTPVLTEEMVLAGAKVWNPLAWAKDDETGDYIIGDLAREFTLAKIREVLTAAFPSTDRPSPASKLEAYRKALETASIQCGNVIFNCEQRPADNEKHLRSWRAVKEYLDAATATPKQPD